MIALDRRREHVPVYVYNVSDGDSFWAEVGGRRVHCRLYGIDAPELPQPYGHQAWQELLKLIMGKTLNGRIITIDCYGRSVVDLMAFTTMRIGRLMLRAGMAWHTPRWSPDRHAFSEAMKWAREGRLGLWHDPAPVPPWTWRREQGHRIMAMRTSRRGRIKRP